MARPATLAVLIVVGAFCFVGGRLSTGQSTSELRQQRALLEKLSQRMEAFGARAAVYAAVCGKGSVPSDAPAALEKAVTRAFDQREAAIAAAKAEQATPTAANLEAFDQGNRLLDDSLGSTRWTQEDVFRMKSILSMVTPQQRELLLQRQTVAFNQGKLKPDFVGPPF
jgi:hypothetical protein